MSHLIFCLVSFIIVQKRKRNVYREMQEFLIDTFDLVILASIREATIRVFINILNWFLFVYFN